MTKIIILGEHNLNKTKTPIQFLKLVTNNGIFDKIIDHPSEYKNIELICKKYEGEYDLMFAYMDDRNIGRLYFGFFNDGIVE